MTQTYPIVGFAPDASPDTPGIFTDTTNTLPTERGVGPGLNVTLATDTVLDEGASDDVSTLVLGAAALPKLDGTYRYFYGTSYGIYETNLAGFAMTRRATIVSPVTDLWSFAQFGDITLVANKVTNLMKLSSTDGSFSTVSGAPTANIVVVCGEPNAAFAMTFGYDDGSGYLGDGIFWSGISAYTTWTTGIDTQSGKIRLTDINGAFTAAIPYRDGVIAWKDHSMHVGTYVGGAAVWAWSTVSKDIGCIGKYACCVADDVVYFANTSGIWMYDGSYPRRVPGQIHRYWRENMLSFASGVVPQIRWRKSTRTLMVGGEGNVPSAKTPSWLMYHPESGIWTKYGYLSGGDNVAFVLDDGMAGVAHSTKTVTLDAGNFSGTSTLYTGAFGNPFSMTTLRGIRPAFATGPADTQTGWVAATGYGAKTLRNLFTNAAQSSATFVESDPQPSLDGMASGRYVGAVLTVTYPKWEITSISYDLFTDGSA